MGETPPDYLVAAGLGLCKRSLGVGQKDPDSVWAGTYHDEGAFLYEEWDFSHQHHRKAWCVLREHALPAGDLDFQRASLAKYGKLIKSIRRTFEVLRGADKAFKRQPHGEDIDALVETHAGRAMTQLLFLRQHKDERRRRPGPLPQGAGTDDR